MIKTVKYIIRKNLHTNSAIFLKNNLIICMYNELDYQVVNTEKYFMKDKY